MAKISFPYMGESVVAYKKIGHMLGHEVIEPPKPTQKTVDLGVKHAPEFACFPLKVLLGTYLEEIALGADLLMSSGGHGPCRAGYYGEMHRKILSSLGYQGHLIIFDAPQDHLRDFYQDLKRIKGKNSWIYCYNVLKLVYRAIKIMDELEQKVSRLRAYEVKTGSVNRAWEQIQELVNQAFTLPQLEAAQKESHSLLDSLELIPVKEEHKLRIGIIGEIYVVMENSTNMMMEQKLGELGCEVRRSQYLSDWVDFNLLPHWISHPHEAEIQKMGTKYFDIGIGGHARENMGWIDQYSQWGYDGIVHLLPFGCLPELMSQSIIPQVSKDLKLPIISFALDEQSGLANNLTRLEAFVDLIKAQKFGVKQFIYNSKKVG